MPEKPTSADQALPVSRALLVSAVLLLILLLAFPVIEVFLDDLDTAPLVVALAALEVAVAVVGAMWLSRHDGALLARPAVRLSWSAAVWLIALCLPWAWLIVLTRQAAYLAFLLFFLVLWLLPPILGPIAALGLAVMTGLGQSVHHGWSAGAFIGPISAAAFLSAAMIGLRSVIAQSTARAELIDALEQAQERLAVSEREAGRLGERTRIGRELHDTVAQHLSSIQLLVHAAERVGDDAARSAHLSEARAAASSALADTRAFIADLTPVPLAGQSLGVAIERVAAQAGRRSSLRVEVQLLGTPRILPTAVEATVLRIAQEALANVEKHAAATSCLVTVQYDEEQIAIEVSDDGRGFDSEAEPSAAATTYGLAGMRARAADLGGYLAVISDPGEGTLVSAQLPARSEGGVA